MRTKETGLAGVAPRRRSAGLTQQELADAVGISRSLVAMIETGQAWPISSILPAMAEMLGCSIDELYRAPDTDSIPQPEVVDHGT